MRLTTYINALGLAEYKLGTIDMIIELIREGKVGILASNIDEVFNEHRKLSKQKDHLYKGIFERILNENS